MATAKTFNPKVIKLFLCSTQLSMKLILLINVKMPIFVGILTFMNVGILTFMNVGILTFMNVGILTFMSKINYWLFWFKPEISMNFGYSVFMSISNFMLS